MEREHDAQSPLCAATTSNLNREILGVAFATGLGIVLQLAAHGCSSVAITVRAKGFADVGETTLETFAQRASKRIRQTMRRDHLSQRDSESRPIGTDTNIVRADTNTGFDPRAPVSPPRPRFTCATVR
jgi:hypothetical protein